MELGSVTGDLSFTNYTFQGSHGQPFHKFGPS